MTSVERITTAEDIVVRRDPWTLELRLNEGVTVADIARARALLERAWLEDVSADAHPFFVVNTQGLHVFTPAVREPFVELMRAARAAGVVVVIGVSRSAATRMVGTALALASGVPSRALQDDSEVAAVLAEERRKWLARRRG